MNRPPLQLQFDMGRSQELAQKELTEWPNLTQEQKMKVAPLFVSGMIKQYELDRAEYNRAVAVLKQEIENLKQEITDCHRSYLNE